MAVQVLHTPEERFTGVADWPAEPRRVEVPSGLDGVGDLELGVVDQGPDGAETVVLLHGEPTWSVLYRDVVAGLVDRGLRAVAIDLVGMGRSDKPADPSVFTYRRHLGWLRDAVEALGVRDATLVGQDWGGLLGLRLVAEDVEEAAGRWRRLVTTNTFLPTGDHPMPDVWHRFREVVRAADPLDVGRIVEAGCARGLSDEVRAAYDAPFPSEAHKAAVRTFPDLVPTTPDDPESEPNRHAWRVLGEATDLPVLTVSGSADPITAGAEEAIQRLLPGAAGQDHRTIDGAGHFIQEDAGAELAEAIADFVEANPV